jgi:NCS1 family nucleobase:cation symporter-1
MAAVEQHHLIEDHSVDIIPASERTGKAWGLGTFWFAANQQFLTLVTGALGVVLGLNLFWAIVAIVVGNLIGTVFMAYHSAQGPQLGVTQMIQSRGQFGFYGAFFLFIAAFCLQFGFFASATVLSATALHALAPSLSMPLAIVIFSIPVAALAILGYQWLHIWQRVFAVILAILFAVLTVQSISKASSLGLPHGSWSATAPDWGLFLVIVSISATYAITWAPFVSDYSRYLPEDTSVRSSFWWTYGGTVISCIWLEALGCLVTALYPKADTAGALAAISGSWILLVMSVSLIGAATTNLYSGMVALVTAATTWKPPRPSALTRIAGIGATFVVGLVLALAGYHSFLTNFENFLLVLAFVFIPWTAVNLTDFYVIRRGRYDPSSFFTSHGVYGGWIWQTIVAYLIGIAVEIPFIDQQWYTGPLVKHLGGADISWIVGLVVPVVLYVVLCHLWPPAGVEREDRLIPAGAQDPYLPDSELVATQSTRDRTGA